MQTLALLAHRHLEDRVALPSLLVVPTSLVGNWRREAARFVPDLKLLVLHGPDRRHRFPEIPEHHLVVTTYPLLNRDHEALFGHDYDTAVLDEAQAVKNPAAAVSKRIREIRARQRLALTGTPLENNLQELWALYDWLTPGSARKPQDLHGGFPDPDREARRPRQAASALGPGEALPDAAHQGRGRARAAGKDGHRRAGPARRRPGRALREHQDGDGQADP